MAQDINQWTKKELQIYILLLCANADADETDEELAIIKSKVDSVTFNKIYEEFSNDTEEEGIDKVDRNIHRYDFTNQELSELRHEMNEIFNVDSKFKQMERNLNRIMDNILY
ncbi:MAG: hypothetical protein AAF688_15965 [Bacteroidota bacterium]